MVRGRFWVSLVALLTLLGLLVGAPAVRSEENAPPQPERGRHDGKHVLVGFQAGTFGATRASAHAEERSRFRNRFDHIDVDVVEVPDGADPVNVAARYERNPNVAFAHPNWQVSILSNKPNDTLFGDQWGLHNTGQAVNGSLGDFFFGPVADVDVDGPEGWAAVFPNGLRSEGGARVAIIDTGIDRFHVDLRGKTKACASALTGIGRVTAGVCDDDNLHGTHVAGTVAALTNNDVGVAGVAPNAELAIFKALNGAGVGWTADIIAGIDWAHKAQRHDGDHDGGGAKILSMSFGGSEDDAEHLAVKDASDAGALVIAAAGNDGDGTLSYPAAYSEVMSVASVSQDGKRSWFSTCNRDVEIAAPGEDIWSTFPANSYGIISGTSMSTPHVSGVAAMVWWRNASLSADQVRSRLKSTTEGSGGCRAAGVVNLANALGGSGTTPPPPSEPGAITGKVSNQKSKAGIVNATVDCGSAGAGTTSGDGTYTIRDVPSGGHSCTASATGYGSKTQPVTVTSGETTTADFLLR